MSSSQDNKSCFDAALQVNFLMLRGWTLGAACQDEAFEGAQLRRRRGSIEGRRRAGSSDARDQIEFEQGVESVFSRDSRHNKKSIAHEVVCAVAVVDVSHCVSLEDQRYKSRNDSQGPGDGAAWNMAPRIDPAEEVWGSGEGKEVRNLGVRLKKRGFVDERWFSPEVHCNRSDQWQSQFNRAQRLTTREALQ